VAFVLTAGCTYPKLLFWHKNLENIHEKIFRKEKIHSMQSLDSKPGFKPWTNGFHSPLLYHLSYTT